MQTAEDMRNALKNIRYYSEKIRELLRKQLDLDFQNKAVNVDVGTVRFDCLGIIGGSTYWLDIYCDNIESNLKSAEAQDKELINVTEEQ